MAIAAAGGWQWREADAPRSARAPDPRPLARARRTTGRRRRDGRRVGAVAASPPRSATRRARRASGTGDLLRAVLDAGIRDIVLGIGGSATTDGGAGPAARARAREVSDDLATRRTSPASTRACRRRRLADRVRRDQPAARADGRGGDLRAAEGRDSPRRRARRSTALRPVRGRARARDRPARARHARAPARPAASGSRLLAIAGPVRVARAPAGRRAGDGGDRLRRAPWRRRDLVLTGEGRIDAQTAFGKTALGVAQRAQAAGKRVHRLRRRRDAGGDRGAGRGRRDRRARSSRRRRPSRRRSPPGTAPVERCGERIARLFSAAMDLPAATPHLSLIRDDGNREATTGRSEAEEAGEEARPPQARSGQGVGQLPPTLPAGARRATSSTS